MVVSFVNFVEMKQAEEASYQAQIQAEALRCEHLEQFLSALLVDLQAA